MHIDPLPKNTHALVPHLTVKDAPKAMDYYKKVFMAEEVMRMMSPDGKHVVHAEMLISGCMIYLADEMPKMGHKSPQTLGGSPVGLTLYCLDADKVFNRAVKHGAKSVRPMEDAFWGDRHGTVQDPFGHSWTLMTRQEELTVAQITERGKKAMAHA